MWQPCVHAPMITQFTPNKAGYKTQELNKQIQLDFSHKK